MAPLADPASLFGAIPSVRQWTEDGRSTYILTITDPIAAMPAVTRALVGVGADVLSIAEQQRSLEDVYLQLVDEKAAVE